MLVSRLRPFRAAMEQACACHTPLPLQPRVEGAPHAEQLATLRFALSSADDDTGVRQTLHESVPLHMLQSVAINGLDSDLTLFVSVAGTDESVPLWPALLRKRPVPGLAAAAPLACGDGLLPPVRARGAC